MFYLCDRVAYICQQDRSQHWADNLYVLYADCTFADFDANVGVASVVGGDLSMRKCTFSDNFLAAAKMSSARTGLLSAFSSPCALKRGSGIFEIDTDTEVRLEECVFTDKYNHTNILSMSDPQNSATFYHDAPEISECSVRFDDQVLFSECGVSSKPSDCEVGSKGLLDGGNISTWLSKDDEWALETREVPFLVISCNCSATLALWSACIAIFCETSCFAVRFERFITKHGRVQCERLLIEC